MSSLVRTGKNHLKGGLNGGPKPAPARGIEIDMRQMLDEDLDTIPCQFLKDYDVKV